MLPDLILYCKSISPVTDCQDTLQNVTCCYRVNVFKYFFALLQHDYFHVLFVLPYYESLYPSKNAVSIKETLKPSSTSVSLLGISNLKKIPGVFYTKIYVASLSLFRKFCHQAFITSTISLLRVFSGRSSMISLIYTNSSVVQSFFKYSIVDGILSDKI